MNIMNINDFKKELKELLAKYNASIDFVCSDSSDFEGITGEKMTVYINGKRHVIIDDWGFNSRDL